MSRRDFLKYAILSAGAATAAWGGYSYYRSLQNATTLIEREEEEGTGKAAQPVKFDKIAHLLRRAGFGASPEEYELFSKLDLQSAVDRLVNYEQVPDSAPALAFSFTGDYRTDLRNYPAVVAWWVSRIVHTTRPLQEKMVLFWHNHFATAISKVRNLEFMYQQNQLFREMALGNFRDLLLAVAKDPAMLIWLDSNSNRKGAANENFARELLELFSMGIGNYTERDIQEAARAFTGWHLNRQGGKFFFNARLHDDGEKEFLGRRGKWNGDDIIDIVAEQKATAKFISRRLFMYFAYRDPEPEVVERLADVYFQSKYSIRAIVKAILTSNEFYSEKAYHSRVKSPTEYVVTALRSLKASVPEAAVLGTLGRMSQQLMNPPNVGGWQEGLGWINSATLFERFNFPMLVQTSRESKESQFDPAQIVKEKSLQTPEQTVDYFTQRFLLEAPTPELRSLLVDYMRSLGSAASGSDLRILETRIRSLVRLIMASPDYQVS